MSLSSASASGTSTATEDMTTFATFIAKSKNTIQTPIGPPQSVLFFHNFRCALLRRYLLRCECSESGHVTVPSNFATLFMRSASALSLVFCAYEGGQINNHLSEEKHLHQCRDYRMRKILLIPAFLLLFLVRNRAPFRSQRDFIVMNVILTVIAFITVFNDIADHMQTNRTSRFSMICRTADIICFYISF